MKEIPFIKPKFPSVDLVKEDLEKIYESNWYTNSGPFEKQLASGLEKYIGQDVRVSILCNATIALMMAVEKLFDKNKKKVLIQSFTFAAGAHAIVWGGFEPVFFDIDEGDWQPNIEEVESYLKNYGDNVAGLIVGNVFGIPVQNMDRWERLAKEHNLALVVDSAAGVGSVYPDGKMMGGRGDCEIFSFHATKPFGAGEGGAIVSRNHELINDFEKMKNFGFDNGSSEMLGVNAKVAEIICAIGCRVLSEFPEKLKKRREILRLYKKHLDLAPSAFPVNDDLGTVSYVAFLLKDNKAVKRVGEALKENHVMFRHYYNPPLHKQGFFKKFDTVSNLKTTNDICSRTISLPVIEEFTEADIMRIAKIVKESL